MGEKRSFTLEGIPELDYLARRKQEEKVVLPSRHRIVATSSANDIQWRKTPTVPSNQGFIMTRFIFVTHVHKKKL